MKVAKNSSSLDAIYGHCALVKRIPDRGRGCGFGFGCGLGCGLGQGWRGRGHPGCGIPCSVAPIITLLARSMLPEYAPASYLMSRGPRAIVAEVMDSEDLSKGLLVLHGRKQRRQPHSAELFWHLCAPYFIDPLVDSRPAGNSILKHLRTLFYTYVQYCDVLNHLPIWEPFWKISKSFTQSSI